MTIPTIAFIRETNLLTDALVRSYVASQRLQLTRDLLPRWGLTADCVFAAPGEPIPIGAWQCVFLDNSDQADALGYHDLTDAGLPVMKIFMADALWAQVRWTVTASHEVIETLGDPGLNKTAIAGGVEYSFELCDAPEDDSFSYWVGEDDITSTKGHHLSAFVLPSWFDPDGVAPFTFPIIPEIDAPFKLAPGGYIGVRTPPVVGTWSQRFADGPRGARSVKGPKSRTLRRFASGAAVA